MHRTTTLCEALGRAARNPDFGLRLLDRQETPTFRSWAEVEAQARPVAAGLARAGLRPGACVALVYATGFDFFRAFFGILLAGGVPVPLYPPIRLGRMAEYHAQTGAMLAAARVEIVLSEPRILRLLGETAGAAVRAGGSAPRCFTVEDIASLTGPEPAPPCPDDLGLVQFSSGTTGAPRPIALTHRALLAQSRIIESFLTDQPGRVHAGVSWLPLYHDMGLVGCVLPALDRPGMLTLLGPEHFVTRPAAWLRAISRWKGTVSPAPNFAYALCTSRIRDEELDDVDLSCWSLALCGAEPVAPAVLRAFAERFGRWGLRPEALKPVYGLAEAALAVSFTLPDRPMSTVRLDREALARGEVEPNAEGVEISRLGPPVPGFEIRVVAEDGLDVAPGRIGRVLVKGPSVMSGYLHQPAETARVLHDGWLDTGDRGFLVDGELVVTGREKEVLVVRGRKWPPHVVEQAVEGLSGLRAGCTAALSHANEGAGTERLLLFVETSKDADDHALAELPNACSDAVLSATGLLLDEVILLEPGTLPRTSSGKIRRVAALAAWLGGTLTPPSRVTPLAVAGWYLKSAWSFARLRRIPRDSR